MTTVVMTPERARLLLESNTNNPRPLKPAWVGYLTDQIRQGRWMRTSDAIGIDANGVIVNGQHRLHAIATAGIPVEIEVTTGLDPEAGKVTDNGRPRSMSDLIKQSPALCGEVAVIMNRITGHSRKFAPQVIEDAIDWWHPAHDAVRQAGAGRVKAAGNTAVLRVGWGLRWAVEKTPLGRAYVLEQLRYFFSGDVPRMSRATATLWRRSANKRASNTNDLRQTWGPMVYHGVAYSRRDSEPLLRNPDETKAEMSAYLRMMQDAFTGGPARDGHPYVWVEHPKVSRQLYGAAAESRNKPDNSDQRLLIL